MKIKLDAASDPSQKTQLNLEWELHKIQAESAYHQLNEDAAYAKSHTDAEMLTFDLEKSPPTPVLSTGIVYYKRQLWTYNQGIHDCSTGVAHMYMWNESLALRGSHEVGSCILTHLKKMGTTATVYSDACGGQNRNIYLVCMWLHIVSSSEYSFTTVDHKFMVSGHFQMTETLATLSLLGRKRHTSLSLMTGSGLSQMLVVRIFFMSRG